MARVQLVFDGSSRGAVAAARQTREGLAGVSSEARHVSGSLSQTDRELSRVSRGAVAGSGIFRGLGRSIAFASAAFLGTAGLVSVLRTSVGAAGDLQKQVELNDRLFGAHAKTIRAWSETTVKSLALSSGEALKMTNSIGQMLVPLGVAPQRAAELSVGLTKVAATLAAVRNEDPTDVLTKIETGLRGRGMFLKQYGIDIGQAALAEEALRLGLIKATPDTQKMGLARDAVAIATAKLKKAEADWGAGTTQVLEAKDHLTRAEAAYQKSVAGTIPTLNAQQKAVAAASLILQQGSTYSEEFAKHSGDITIQQRILHAAIKQTEEGIGQALVPTVGKIVTAMADWLSKSENQERIQRDVTRAVDDLTRAAKEAWPQIQAIAHWADTAAKAVGGWGNALRLVIGIGLAAKILAWNRALTALIGTEAAAGAASSASGLAGAAGLTALLRSRLLLLSRIGVITIGIELLINPKFRKSAGAAFKQGGSDWWRFLSGNIADPGTWRALGQAILPAVFGQGGGPPPNAGGGPGGTFPGTGVPTGPSVQIPRSFTPTHQTAGLPGFPAVDIMARPGTPILAPENGVVTRISGHEPTEPPPQGQGGPWGLSLYYLGTESGNTYYMTHLVKVAQPGGYRRGDVIGLIGDYPGSSADHVHVGIHRGDSPEAHYGSGLFNPADYLARPQRGATAQPTRRAAAVAGTAGTETTPVTVGTHPRKGRKPAAPPLVPPRLTGAVTAGEEAVSAAALTKEASDDVRAVNEELKALRAERRYLLALRRRTHDPAKLEEINQELKGVEDEIGGILDDRATALKKQREDLKKAREKLAKIEAHGRAVVAAAEATGPLPSGVLAEVTPRLGKMTGAQLAAYAKNARDAARAAVAAFKLGLAEQAKGLDIAGTILGALKGLPDKVRIQIGTDIFGRPITLSVAKVRQRIAQLIEIIRTGSRKAREAAIAEFAQIAAGVGTAMDAAKQKAKDKAQQLRDTLANALQTALDRVNQGVLTAFDRATQAQVQTWEDDLSNTIDGMQQDLSNRIDGMQRDLAAKVQALQEAGAAPTPGEAALSALQAQHEAAQAAQDLADAQQALADAQASGDPQAVVAALRRLDDLKYQTQVAALQKQADAERKARDADTQAKIQAAQDDETRQEKDLQKTEALQEKSLQKQLAAQIQNYQDMRDAQRQWLDDQLAAWEQNILNGTATITDFANWLKGQGANGVLVGANLPDPVAAMADAGKNQGSAFADAWIDELARAAQAYIAFMNLIQPGYAALSFFGGQIPSNIFTNPGIPPARSGGGGRGGPPPGFQRGGRVPGVYVGREDTILARVTPGEEILDRQLVKALRAVYVDGGGGQRLGAAVVMNRPTFYGGTDRQVHKAIARAIEPHLGDLPGYRSPT